MNAITAQPTTALVGVFDNPVLAVTKPEYFDNVFSELRREAAEIVIDLTTEKGRKAIAAMAFKVARTKTAIDEAGKALNDEARIKINVVDAARRSVREKLDALRDEVRKPLTDWEAAEKARAERIERDLVWLRDAAVVAVFDNTQSLMDRLGEVRAMAIDDSFGMSKGIAESARALAVENLESGIARIEKEAADRAELDKLRAEAAEREEREAAAAQAKAEADAKAAAEKAAAERAANAEAERAAQIQRAADKARADAERAAEAERSRIAAEHAAEIAAERAKAAEIARAAEREAQAKVAADAAAEAEAKRAAALEAARVKNRAHRSAIMGEVKTAIMSCGIDEATAKNVVLAIVAGQVPHTVIQF